MVRQIRLLTEISLCNLFGLNEFRFTKDKKKKSRYYLMGVLWCLVLLMLISYVCAASVGLIFMGAGKLVPALLAMCVSLIVFLFTVLRAGTVLFDGGAFEKQIVLPVEVRAIIVSRFLSLYLINMLLGMLVMLPGMAVYGVMEKPGPVFYFYGLVGSVFLPFLPLTAASVAGAVIAGIGSRWKGRQGKNLVMIVLTMVLVCGILAGSFGIAGVEESTLKEALSALVPALGEQIRTVYPPALWLSEAMTEGSLSGLCLFVAVPAGTFLIFLEILGHFYGKICGLLSSDAPRAQKNCTVRDMRPKAILRSMTERELRHYFSSVAYVTNTLVGEVMMVLLAIGVGVVGKESIDGLLGVEGIAERALPVLLGMVAAMMPVTACSVSMEGKQWWMMQTFPVRERMLMSSKVLANLLIAFPFYLVSELVLLFTLKPDAGEALSLLTVPAVYILFSAEAGLAINRRFPVFEWENETRVVKQSLSVSLSVLVGILSGALSLGILIGAPGIPAGAVYIVTMAVLGMVALVLAAK